MSKKILLIDDDQDLLRAYQVTLKSQGYSVISADNGSTGYDLLCQEQPDLLVLDVMMNTELEGYNLLHKIKGDPVWRNLPVILLTGMSNQLGVNLISGVEDDERLPNVVFQDKPIDPAKLISLVDDLLKITGG